jgi:peroxiredoxin Q/BCP
MDEIQVGQVAPDFSLSASGGTIHSLSQYRGQKLVLYFYPRDNTPACTNEAREFGAGYEEIRALGAVVLGVSRDSISAHEKFSAKNELPFVLLSDIDGTVCKLYQVLREKNMYGKKVIGIERSTFLIDETGIITHIFRKVKVAGHVGAVLAALK